MSSADGNPVRYADSAAVCLPGPWDTPIPGTLEGLAAELGEGSAVGATVAGDAGWPWDEGCPDWSLDECAPPPFPVVAEFPLFPEF